MRIAVASGKGGTGKTMIATNLAYTASLESDGAVYMDCDVEEPNGCIFLKPEIRERAQVKTPIPIVDEDICIHCGKCGEICRYSAIVSLGDRILTFPELCHSCGGCSRVCPVGAITETGREIGWLETGDAGNLGVIQGTLNIGEVRSPSLIDAVKAASQGEGMVFIDSPPGTSCPVVEAVKGSDFVVLVTEPTPFGLNDLELAMEMVRVLGLPFGILVNRADLCDEGWRSVLDGKNVTVLGEIPFDRQIAEAYSKGELVCRTLPYYGKTFSDLLERTRREAGR